MSIHAKLAKVQKELKAPKNQYNSFGKYKYRSCEDILEGLKLVIGDMSVTISDDMQMVGDRIYVKATVTISDGKESISCSAYARESLDKKGMDDSQITGTASSYARKYALNGMFLTDDTKDADSMDNSVQSGKPQQNKPQQRQPAPAQQKDYSALITKYKSLDEAGKTKAWEVMNQDQKTAVAAAMQEQAA